MKYKFYFLVILLFGITVVNAQSGTHIFNTSYVHTIKMYTSVPYFWDTMTQRYDESLSMPGGGGGPVGSNDPILFDSIIIDNIKIDSCGVKQKGFFSNWGADSSLKKPLKIEFNEFVRGQRFDELKDLNLGNAFQDPTFMHDHLSLKILRDFGLNAPRSSYANVYINDTLWGLYIILEQVSTKFLTEHFGDNNGNLYKCISSTDLRYLGSTPTRYKEQFEKKTNESADDWSDLIQLTLKIRDTPADSIHQFIDLNVFLKTLAVDVALNNWDSYFEHGRNFYLYNDTITKKFQWIPWDYNLAFDNQDYEIMLPDSRSRKPLINKCLNSTYWKQQYFQYICELNQGFMNDDYLFGYIDSTKSLINSSVAADVNSFYSYNTFDSSISYNTREVFEIFPGIFDTFETRGLKPFISSKHVYLFDQLDLESYSCTTSTGNTNEQTITKALTQIFPNPAADYLQIFSHEGPVSNAKVRFVDMMGQLISEKQLIGTIIDIREIPDGMYVLQVVRQGAIYSAKLLIQR